MANKTHQDPKRQQLSDIEQALAQLTLEDLPMEDEPSRVLEGLPLTPDRLAAQLMGQVVYQINRRIRQLDRREPHGMNRTMLAERMGVSKPQVSRLLGAQSNTTLLTVAKAALALGLTSAILKLIPEEDVPHQHDEVKAFVEDESAWWPLTDRRVHSTGAAPVLPIRRPLPDRAFDAAANDFSYAYATYS